MPWVYKSRSVLVWCVEEMIFKTPECKIFES